MKKRAVLLTVSLLFLLAVTSWPRSLGVLAAPPVQGADIAVISQPASNAIVSGVVQIIGSADHPSFQFYVIDIAPEPNLNNDQWATLGTTHDKPVINGVLETWDTTLFPDGSYTLRLRVVRLDGNYAEYFTRQVVVSNTQPTPTPTPEVKETPTPTVTPTPLPPTPTIVIEGPVVDTPTPRPIPTNPPLENPDESDSLVPTVTGFSVSPLVDACIYGAGVMLGVFLLFGLLATLRLFIQGFIDRVKRKS